jgi:hypothetical protein
MLVTKTNRRLRLVALVLAGCLSPFALSSLPAGPAYCAPNSGGGAKAHPDSRRLHFPGKSIGTLLICKTHNDDDTWQIFGYGPGEQVGGAQGDVSLTIPPGYNVVLEANRRLFENPALLKEVSPNGIDLLRLSFTSMDDREDHMLDQAVGYVDNIRGLRVLFFDRSETNDAQVSKLRNLPHLCSINFFWSSIDGSCFAGLSAFPELYEIDAPLCQLDEQKLIGLARIPKLRNLDLGRDHLTLTGAKSLAKLVNLVHLSVGDNPQFDDECVKFLQPLSHLRSLDLRGTKITLDGIKSIRGLHLQSLYLPGRLQKNSQQVKAMLPNTQISYLEPKPPRVSKDDNRIFAPLH